MTDFSAAGAFGDSTTTSATVLSELEALLAASKQFPGGEALTELTIASGAIVPTRGAHTVDTESAAPTDDLSNVQTTNVRNGALLILWPESTSRVVTVKHEAGGDGQISLRGGSDFALEYEGAAIILQLVGSTWKELFRGAEEGPGARGQQLFTSSGVFTVPAGITEVFVTAVGGGGGGGGGGSSGGTDGADASNGVASSFGAYAVTGGGFGGAGGLATGQGGAGGAGGGQNGQHHFGQYGGAGGRTASTPLGIYGRGGAGGAGGDDSGATSGGGGGGGGGFGSSASVRKSVSGLTPGASVTVTVGAGGAGGAGGTDASGNGTNGSAGSSGAVLVEW